ncbi:uncharacterized protein Dana_GF26524 [Drosophila ananassae]|uniref:MADF domain-containing protein n=1 Tax=Drosophila ananassae TaxID=7217 RepID=A0A0P8XKZ8_DROAN|nr:uncharacterized protein LOC26513933 [Drosophila ananassae]XP_032307963.1 uncharacterized protein LOC26513933 [Drosophila ananassae]KPU75448.1 uncharacterized protein Dana_GF26524 [Drosophila ananassae]
MGAWTSRADTDEDATEYWDAWDSDDSNHSDDSKDSYDSDNFKNSNDYKVSNDSKDSYDSDNLKDSNNFEVSNESKDSDVSKDSYDFKDSSDSQYCKNFKGSNDSDDLKNYDSSDVFVDFYYYVEYRYREFDPRDPLESSSDAYSESSGSEYKDSTPSSPDRSSSDSYPSTHDEYSEFSVPSLDLSEKSSFVLPNFEGDTSPSVYSSLCSSPSSDDSSFKFSPALYLDANALSTDRGLQSPTRTLCHGFNSILLELYASHECLWNINHSKFLDSAAKSQAWREVSWALEERSVGSVSPDFCRRRVTELRHFESRYRLRQMREAQHHRRVDNSRRVVVHADPETLQEAEQKLICSSCSASNSTTSLGGSRKSHAFIKRQEFLQCPIRDISMSGGDQLFEDRSLELLSEEGYERCFQFLDKIFQ